LHGAAAQGREVGGSGGGLMRHFLKLGDGIDPLPALLQLQDNADLWDAYRARTEHEGSPHAGVYDIWIRYRDRAELTEPKAFIEPHHAVWWPAWNKLPALRPIVFLLAAKCEATAIGGVFITRIRPGGRVLPHDDAYSWHAQHYNRKVYVPLAGNGRCINRVEHEEVVMGVGSAWLMNNLVEHEVRNEGDSDRITLIACYRGEG